MTLQPTTRTTNGEGLRRMNDIFDSMYTNLLKINTSANPRPQHYSSIPAVKQQTVESNLLSDRKDNFSATRKQANSKSLDTLLLKEEIEELRKELGVRDKIIQQLESKAGRCNNTRHTMQQMQKQIKFLSQNNQTLYRSTYKLQQEIMELKEVVLRKTEAEERASREIEEYQKEIGILKKLNKEMLQEQKMIMKNEIQDVSSFKQVKSKFEKENDLLQKKLSVMEREKEWDRERERDYRGFRKSLNKSIEKYVSVSNPSHYQSVSPTFDPPSTASFALPPSEMNQIKEQIAQLKRSVNVLSTKKLSRKKSMSSTPVKKTK